MYARSTVIELMEGVRGHGPWDFFFSKNRGSNGAFLRCPIGVHSGSRNSKRNVFQCNLIVKSVRGVTRIFRWGMVVEVERSEAKRGR